MVAESWRQRQGRRRNKVSALDTTLDPSLNGYDNVQDLLAALTDLGGSTAQIITPEGLGADNTGMTDAFPEVKEAIETAAAGGFRCELRGTYRLEPTSVIQATGGIKLYGGGSLYVASAPIGNRLIDVLVEPLATYEVLQVEPDVYDYAGVNSSDSKVTKLTLAEADADLVFPGMEVKLVSQDQPAGGVSGAYQGEHAYVLAVASPYVYLSAPVRYAYTTTMSLLILDTSAEVFCRDLKFSADWDALVANNWSFEYMRIAGAVEPVLGNLRMRDGADAGIRLAGTVRAVSSELAFKRFRNAIITHQITGYGIRETGTFGSVHLAPRGQDCRHVWTSTTGAGAGLDLVVNGRCIGATIFGGEGQANNACAWDTHPDADGVTFAFCKSFAAYDGEAGSYSGIQLRGNSKAIGCEVFGGQVGYLLKREYANEEGVRRLVDCDYYGNDQAIVTGYAVGLTGADREVAYDIEGGYHETDDIFAWQFLAPGKGKIRRTKVKLTCATEFHSLIHFESEAASAVLDAKGIEVDIQDATGGSFRLVKYEPAGVQVDIEATISNGAVPWTAWVAPAAGFAETITAYGRIEADTMPTSTDGGASVPVGSTWAAHVTAKGGRIGNNGRRIRVAVGNEDKSLSPGNSLYPVLQIMVTANSTGSRITAIDAGLIEGQLLFIHSDPDSLQDLDIVPSEANRIRAAATLVLAPKAGATFMWTWDEDGDNTKDTGMWCHVGS